MASALNVDECCTLAVQRLAFSWLDYAVLPGAVLFGWQGIFPSLLGTFLIGGSATLYVAFLALAVGQMVNRGLKVLLQRRRPMPPTDVPRKVRVKVPSPDDPDGASFPSGDTMAGSAIGAALALSGQPWCWWLLGLYAGFARVFFWCHFVSDAVAGYLVGSASALLISSLSGGGQALRWWHIPLATPGFVVIMKLLKKVQAKRHAEG